MDECAVDGWFLVANEAMGLISAMRKSSQWVHSSMSAILGMQLADETEPLPSRLGVRHDHGADFNEKEPDLIAGLSTLCTEVALVPNIGALSADKLLAPFLHIIRSPSTPGSLTLSALQTVEKFLSLNIVNRKSADIGSALYHASIAVTHCRFEASSQTENDAVLHQLLFLMHKLVCGSLGSLLCTEAICEIVETCLSMACRMSQSDGLRRTAVMTLSDVVRFLFGKLSNRSDAPGAEVVQLESPAPRLGHLGSISAGTDGGSPQETQSGSDKNEESSNAEYSPDAADPVSFAPFDDTAVKKVFVVLVSILNPASPQFYDDATRTMVLRFLIICFETSGRKIAKHASLVDIVSTQLFKYLAQLIRRTKLSLVSESLKLILIIMQTDTNHYKLQIELILTYLLTCLAPTTDLPRDTNIDRIFYDGVPNRPKFVKVQEEASKQPSPETRPSRASTPSYSQTHAKTPELREVMVEALALMAHAPYFFSNLFSNYDCDVQRVDLCEDLVGFLCRNAYPDSATWSTASVPPLCLEATLSLLQSLRLRAKGFKKLCENEDADAIVQAKERKGLDIKVAEEFGKSPKKGVDMALQTGIIQDTSPESVANFLRNSRRLNKTVLGRYIAKKDNAEILSNFIQGFDFSNRRIDEALREFLSFFRLPGESGEIEPIFERFSEQYVKGEGNDEVIANSDAAFVLCYSIIMLNTDQHSPQVKNRMPFDSFKNNLRGTNGKEDFPDTYLKEIYDTIKSREIILPDEHDNDESFEFTWKNLLLQLSQTPKPTGDVTPMIDKQVFIVSWLPIASTLSFIFATATDDLVFSRVISGFHQMSKLAAIYCVEGVTDHVINCLSKISTLCSGDLAAPTQNIKIIITDATATAKEHAVIVSDLSVPFGSDLKAQMASITLFRIVSDEATTALGPAGWELVAKALTNLYLYDLITVEDAVNPIPPLCSFERSKAGKSVGIFSALSSYLTTSSDAPPEPSDEDVDAALGAQDCIKACDISGIMERIRHCATNDCVSGIIAAMPSGQDGEQYYAAIYFLLDLLCNAANSSDEIARTVSEFLAGFNVEETSSEFIGKVTDYLLRVSSKIGESNVLGVVLSRQESAFYFYPSLLLFDGGNEGVWSILSQFDITSTPGEKKTTRGRKAKHSSKVPPNEQSERLAQELFEYYERNVGLAPADALGDVAGSLSKVFEAGHAPALPVLYSLQERIQSRDQLKKFLKHLVESCTVPDVRSRDLALDELQALVQQQKTPSTLDIPWQELFQQTLIPLLERLLKQDIYKRDPRGMDVTRQRAASILCKTFLQCALQDDAEITTVWEKILRVLDRLVSSRQQQALTESIEEMVKNVVLVLRLSQKGDKEFWDETAAQLKSFLPDVAVMVNKDTSELDAPQPTTPLAEATSSDAHTAEDIVDRV